MAVARSYEKFVINGEPFKENGRMYVNVVTPKGLKKVRWYTDAERAKMDKTAGIEVKKDIMDFDGRHAFGFGDDGYIIIYQGDEEVIEEWAQTHRNFLWRNLTFGYYTPSRLTNQITEVPSNITAIKLTWNEVQDSGNKMKPHEEIQRYIMRITHGDEPEHMSVYQGSVDTWIERDLVIIKNKLATTHFGDKHIHTMQDANGNIYVWETGTKNYPSGSSKRLKMKVKEHKEIGGVKTTVVYYCKEI